MNLYSVNGYLSAAERHRNQLLDYLLEAAQGMEDVESCYIYSVGIDPEDDSKVYIYEVWENQEAHAKSLEMDIFQNLISKAKPIITGMQDFPDLTIKGGKGLEK